MKQRAVWNRDDRVTQRQGGSNREGSRQELYMAESERGNREWWRFSIRNLLAHTPGFSIKEREKAAVREEGK